MCSPLVSQAVSEKLRAALGVCPICASASPPISKPARFDLIQPAPDGIKTSARRKTRNPSDDRSAAEMAFARRPARLRFVRPRDNRAADRSRPRTGRDLFLALPDAGMPCRPERLVLSGKRLVGFTAGHPRNARSEHLEQLKSLPEFHRISVRGISEKSDC